MNSKLLVVAINGLLLIEFIRPKLLTDYTLAKELLSLISRTVESRSLKISTFTPKVHLFKLREHTGSLGHHASKLNECV